MDYKKFLDLFDFEREDMAFAKKALAEKGEQQAAKEIIAHFRGKRSVRYLFDREKATFLNDPSILEDAQKAMNHEIFGHKFNGPIDWTFNPTADTSRDNEWSWSLFRTLWWQSLGRAYMMTGDEKYVKEFSEQLISFYNAWPAESHIISDVFETKTPFPGHAWRTIESGIRIYTTWLPCFEMFRTSENFTEEAFMTFLCSIDDHGRFLTGHYSNHNRSSNWLSMETTALLQIGILFPELKNAAMFYENGYERVMHEIAYCFDMDGVHMEKTPIYHMVASISFLQAVRMCQRNNIPVAPYAMPLLEKSAEYVMRLVKPNFTTPMLGDADTNDILARRSDTSLYEGMNLSFFTDDLNEMRAYFKRVYLLTGRKDFLWVATAGKEGTKPSFTDTCFKESGVFVLKEDWDQDSSFVMTQMIKLERGEKSTHSHNDTGHVELMISGEDILVDCGRYIYNSSIWKDWRHYFTGVFSHNTLFVDDHNMGDVPEVTRVRGVRGFVHQFVHDDDKLMIDLSHNGYVFSSDPVFHRRRIVYLRDTKTAVVLDTVEGPSLAEHDFRFYWNFASVNLTKKCDNQYVFTTGKGRSYNVSHYQTENNKWNDVLLIGAEEPEKGGWISYGYPIRVPTAQLSARTIGKSGFTMVTVIAPQDVKVSVSVDGLDAKVVAGKNEIVLEKGVTEVR
ncbi:MAG: alginate lyase family protein [Sphaerochaetaceae bacterium]|nr:alginate lyase family protein [Sphaerochaetaceae bacterium]